MRRLQDPLREAEQGLRALIAHGEENGELVRAEAGEDVLLADDAAQAPGQGGQHRVAHIMPVRVIHLLELVDVDHQHRKARFIGSGLAQGPRKLFLEQHAIGNAGQAVIAKRGLRQVLGLAALRHLPLELAFVHRQHRDRGECGGQQQREETIHRPRRILLRDGAAIFQNVKVV